MIKEIIIRIANKANKISVCKNILKTAVSPTAVNPVIQSKESSIIHSWMIMLCEGEGKNTDTLKGIP